MYLNEAKNDKSKADFKRQMKKDVLEDNRKLDEIKKNTEFLEKERKREEEFKFLSEQEKVINKGDLHREKLIPQKEENILMSSTNNNNFNNTYEETLRKLQMQSINKCNEIEERIVYLENKIDKDKRKSKLVPVQRKDLKVLRPLYTLLGADNHVGKWKGPEEASKKAPGNSKSVGDENLKSIMKSKNTTGFFATQNDKK